MPADDVDSFIGLELRQARTLAVNLALSLRDWSMSDVTEGESVLFTDDQRTDRVNVWLGSSGLVSRAEIF